MNIMQIFWISMLLLMAPSAYPGSETSPSKVLVITGGHGFERAPFFEMFGKMDVEYKEVVQPDANDIYGSEEVHEYDALIFYDMVQDINETQKQAFLRLLKDGKGMVFLHHSLASYQNWDLFHEILGGEYILPNMIPPEDSLLASDYRHDEQVNVIILDHEHPVTTGLGNFTLLDEIYINYQVGAHVTPLLKTDHPLSTPVIGWANKHGKSRVVYLQSGHDHHAFEDPNFLKLLKQSIEWVGSD
jgi:type 1 glutamine amidotransferase